MRRLFQYSFSSLMCLGMSFVMYFGLATSAGAQTGTVVPAGTLLQCTLDEPNFSSATVNVGDPVVCYLKSVQQFGHIVLPRGSYLEGHLAAERIPVIFGAKGTLGLNSIGSVCPPRTFPCPVK
jgi:hypothetical protein